MNDTIKTRIIELFSSVIFSEINDATEREKLEVVDILIEKLGGWDKIMLDIQIGSDNGYTFEQQFSLLKSAIEVLSND